MHELDEALAFLHVRLPHAAVLVALQTHANTHHIPHALSQVTTQNILYTSHDIVPLKYKCAISHRLKMGFNFIVFLRAQHRS
jgi:hypothetical protein